MLPYKPDWSRRSTSTGYEVVYAPDHPRSWSTGYVYSHRVIVEQHLGRLLSRNEVVHHVDGNRRNNDIENLEILTPSRHSSRHAKGAAIVRLVCPWCQVSFEVPRRNTHLVKKTPSGCTTCSSVCRGRLYREIQLGRGDFSQRMNQEVVLVEPTAES